MALEDFQSAEDDPLELGRKDVGGDDLLAEGDDLFDRDDFTGSDEEPDDQERLLADVLDDEPPAPLPSESGRTAEEPADERLAFADIDEDDDLFNFDEIVEEARRSKDDIDASINELLDLEDGVLDPVASSPQESPPPERVRPSEGSTLADLLASVEQGPSTPRGESTGSPRFLAALGAHSPALLALLALLALGNIALVGVSWKSLNAMQGALTDIGARIDQAAQNPRTEPAGDLSRWTPVEIDARAEGRRAIDLARVDLEDASYERARRRLYSVLCVIDRVDERERDSVEEQARLLVADSWRLESARLAGGTP